MWTSYWCRSVLPWRLKILCFKIFLCSPPLFHLLEHFPKPRTLVSRQATNTEIGISHFQELLKVRKVFCPGGQCLLVFVWLKTWNKGSDWLLKADKVFHFLMKITPTHVHPLIQVAKNCWWVFKMVKEDTRLIDLHTQFSPAYSISQYPKIFKGRQILI